MQTTEAAGSLIQSGAPLLIAGVEQALDRLPRGRWIGGTIPYFMDPTGGLEDTERVFVTKLPDPCFDARVAAYGVDTIHRVAEEGPDHGFTVLIVPAFSEVHKVFAENAPEFQDMFMKPVIGWVSGVAVDEIGTVKPKVFLGETGAKYTDSAVAMHVALRPEVNAKIDIVNLFKPGHGPILRFDTAGFEAAGCTVDGRGVDLARYIGDNGLDVRLPLVANFCGAIINTAIAGVDAEAGDVRFYAPVFPGVDYRFAGPIDDYATEFERHVPKGVDMAFSCNCILNYLYGNLEGKPLSGTAGPITFGEIAYQLLNQTMVYLELECLP